MKTRILSDERPLFLGIITTSLFMVWGNEWLTDLKGFGLPLIYFLWLFAIMLISSFKVVKHADMLALKLGEPYGTLILTLSVITIEVSMISAMMLVGEDNPTMGRDMMFAVIMIVLNGLIGLSLIIGGIRHREQSFNLQGANAFLAVLIPMAFIGLILPNYTISTDPGTFSNSQIWAVIGITVLLYGAFLIAQTIRHKNYFMGPLSEVSNGEHHKPKSVKYHSGFLIAYMIVIVLLSKKLAILIDFGIEQISAPVALSGLFVAIIVLTPEALAAYQAALRNNLQRSINIGLGSALATIGLTVPAILMIGMFSGKEVVLGLGPVDTFLLVLTVVLSIVNFSSKRSNILHGLVHLAVFLLYILMIFDS
ncbi:calcium:proton antiporter [Lutimonas zeaxanthinifaciens]|uniref:calcium:proton antiporter n=1 Tax=Lutimonas zeaxanthinifaciens TaxID=3060215 RepID=UPI00265D10D1|nr:ionic transporter y4hA [Lutimonas sp. YSD2104]WKK65740.1 ionic transporter y4hA [Lutimonas sp. YSD2104]